MTDEPETVADEGTDEAAGGQEQVAQEVLVEEVSIDGMCGVY